MTPLRQTWQVALRYLRVIARQPAFLFIALVQPIIWLLLFGALFKAVTEIPGFSGGSYVDFLTPGVVVMLAVSSAGWTGMGFIEDINSGVMDRMLASPVWRGALNLGSVAQAVIQILLQTLLIVLLALALGAHYTNGVGGVLILMLVAALLGAAFASFSNGLGVLTRQRESLIGAVTLVLLPLTFLSSALMQQDLAPGWIGTVAKFNPVNWAVEAGRSAAMEQIDWGLVAGRVGLLAGAGRARLGVRDARVRDLPAVALDEPVLVGEDDGLDAVAEVELLQQVPDVRLDRRERDHELLGDLAVGEPAPDEPQHLELAGGEVAEEVGLGDT